MKKPKHDCTIVDQLLEGRGQEKFAECSCGWKGNVYRVETETQCIMPSIERMEHLLGILV